MGLADDRALIFVKEVPDPENFGVVVYDGDGRVTDIVEKAGVVDTRYDAPPTDEAVVGLYCFPPDVFDVIDRLEPSSRGELEITDVNRHYAQEGGSTSCASRAGGRTPASTGSTSRRSGASSRRPARTDERRGRRPRSRCAASRTSAAGSASSGATARCRSATVQTNLSFSRKGVIRGLHYHERGQDDLFVCLEGTARVVVLDRETGATFTEDIGDENPVAIYVPGHHAHGFEALTDFSSATTSPRSTTPTTRTSTASRGTTRGSRTCGARRRRSSPRATPAVLITGAAASSATRSPVRSRATTCSRSAGEDWDVRRAARAAVAARPRPPRRGVDERRRRRGRPQGAAAVNVGGTAHAAALGAPLVAYSTDYVFDGTKAAPYVESDAPAPLSAYGRTKLHGEAAAGERAWIVRSSWLFGETGHNFVRTMLRLGAERDEVAVVDDQRGCPTYVGHLAEATRELVDDGAAFGVWHLAADGDCTWADFAEAIFEEAGSRAACDGSRRASSARRRPRPASSILRSEKGAPRAPALARRPQAPPRLPPRALARPRRASPARSADLRDEPCRLPADEVVVAGGVRATRVRAERRGDVEGVGGACTEVGTLPRCAFS